MRTSTLSALLALPLALAAPNFRLLRPGTVRRTEREPREWHQQEPTGDRFVRLGMRRKAPMHNSAAGDSVQAARRAVETDDLITSTISGEDPTPFPTSSAMFPDPEPTAARVNATAMLTDVAYGVSLWIGNPEQKVTLDFDTGSSETWVSPPCTPLSSVPLFEEICLKYGQYIPEHSQSGFKVNPDLSPPHWISYGSGAVYVTYYRDTIRVNDPETSFEEPMVLEKPVQIALANWAEGMQTGILGAAYGAGYNQNYTGFIDALYNQKLIAHKDFSVALGSVGKDEGEVVFGGIDTSKFVGPLHALPIAQQYTFLEDGFYRYWLDVDFIGITPPGSCVTTPLTNTSFSARFLPDTGTTLTYMPTAVFYGLLNFFPDATPLASYGYVVDCSHLNDQGSIDFGFGEFTIHVPIREFIFQVPPMFPGDAQVMTCVVGAVPVEDFFILGDTFLRSAVVLFRQQEHKVYLAQYMDCGVNIVQTNNNMSGMLGDCGNRKPSNLVVGNEKAEEAENIMTCTTYLTRDYTPIPMASTTGWFATIDDGFANGLFPRPAIQTMNSRRGPPKAGATATAAMEKRQDRLEVVKTTTLVVHDALTVAGFTTLSATTEVLTVAYPVPDEDMEAGTTTECVTATTTEWVEASAASSSSSSEYSSSSDYSSSEYTTTTTHTHRHSRSRSRNTSKHHHKTRTTTCDETSSFLPNWPSSSISTALRSHMSKVPKAAITIPVQTDETVIVKLKTTTYTIIDGVSQRPDFVPEESSTTSWDWFNVTGTGAIAAKSTGGIFTNSSVATGYTSTQSMSPLSSSWVEWPPSTESATVVSSSSSSSWGEWSSSTESASPPLSSSWLPRPTSIESLLPPSSSSSSWPEPSSEAATTTAETLSEDPPTTTHGRWSTTVSGQPDGIVSELSWTPEGGTSTESVPPWVTDFVERSK